MLFAVCTLNAPSYADIAANTLPSLNAAINGKVDNITSGGTTTGLNVTTQGGTGAVGQFDWNTFDVGKDMTVNWAFTAHSQTALNRVLSNNLSQIYGKLTSTCAVGNCSYGDTSKVILINPNGLLFGNGSQVNINSFTASTFDAVGAKNIKDLGSGHDAYAAGLKGKFGPNVAIRFQGSTSAPGNTVKLEGSTWNIDKSAAIVAKDIVVYKDSLISTSLKPNYNSGSGDQSYSNVKLVTSNGVDFTYLAHGYIANDTNVLAGLDGVDYTMQIGSDNPAVDTAGHGAGAKYDAKISSGNVFAYNGGKTAGSNITVKKAAIKGTKLINYANGDILLVAEGQVNVDDSNFTTVNTYKASDPSVNTYDAIGGNIQISGKKGVSVEDSLMSTAHSTKDSTSTGDILLYAQNSGDVNIAASTLNAQGHVLLEADQGKVKLSNGANIQAENKTVPANLKNLEIYGKNGITAANSNLYASKNAILSSTNGDIAVTDSLAYAGNNLNLYANNTLVENSALSYNNLNLYNGSQVNNVTFKGKTTLQDRDSTNGLVVNTNGNLTVDNNELKTRTPGQAYTSAQNQTKITLNSAKNITVKNASSVKSAGEITMNANGGDVTVVDSTVASTGSNVNLNATKNNNVTNSTIEAALNNNLTAPTANNVTNSKLTATKNNVLSAAAANIECSELTADNNDVKATAGNIVVANSKVTAAKNNTLTASNNFTSTNSILTAKANAITATAGAAAFTNSKLIATDTNTVKASGNVTFKYDNTLNKKCTGVGCDGPVANEVTGGSNTITSTGGNVEISNTPVTATVGSNTITADLGDVKIKDSTLDAKVDNNIKGNNVDIECSDLIATNNKSEAVKGNQTVTNTNATATNNNTFSARDNYTTVNSIYTAKNNIITATTGKIDATNVKIAATGKNTITAKGNVTFDYDKSLNKQCTGAGCDGPVGTELKGNNDITSTDGDTTMTGKLTPNDPTKPEDTKTTITAGGDVKTKARVVYDDLYDKTGTIIGEGPLDTQGTKLVINTKGNVNLVLTNTDNVKAGLEIANPSTTPATKKNKIEIIAQDGTLAISRMVTDDLFIHQPNYHLAGQTVLTPADKAVDSYAPTNSVGHQSAPGVEADMAGRAYIEVRHGFNQDYEPSKVEQSGIYQASFNETNVGGVIGYDKHFINLPDGDSTAVKGEFVLSYSKPYECDPLPPVEPDLSDEIGKVTIPLEADIYQQGTITNNLTDPSAGMIAAAASIVIEDEEQEQSDY